MIYFIRQNEQVKIGYTTNIKTRLAGLQVASPYDLSVALLINGSYEEEAELHRVFADDRIRGEWYMLGENIREYIANMNDKDLRYEYGLLDVGELDTSIQTKFIRNKASLTLEEVGGLIGMTRQGVRRIEQSELHGTASMNTLRKYADALGYELQYKLVKLPTEEITY